jgi:RNA polymerase sigma-70 factor (ECF subfamily)
MDATAPEMQTKVALSPEEAARLRAILQRICPPSLAMHREDLVQIALLRILETKSNEQDHPRPASYLWRVAHSAMVDELRRQRRRPVVSLEEAGIDRPAPECRPQLGVAIRDCLQGLSEARREAVGLHLFGHRAEEAAKLLGWDAKRVQNSVYRGLADLRRCLEAKGFEP